MATKAKSKKAADVEEVEDLDELEELDEADEAPANGKKKSSAQQEVTFGASDLAAHLTEKSGKTVSTRELRTLIRKMARDGSDRVNREIKAGNRTRYNWSGLKDPEVKAIIAAFDSGELEADKQEKLAKLKEQKAAKKAAGEPTGKKAKKAKAKAKAKAEDDDDELELDDDE